MGRVLSKNSIHRVNHVVTQMRGLELSCNRKSRRTRVCCDTHLIHYLHNINVMFISISVHDWVCVLLEKFSCVAHIVVKKGKKGATCSEIRHNQRNAIVETHLKRI